MLECAQYADMRTAEDLRAAVKAIRERAGLSVRDMAALVGKSASGYAHYEQRIKDPYLPRKIAQEIANAVESRGVNRAEVLALAGDDVEIASLPAGPADAPALVPVYDVQAAAGNGAVAPDYEAIADQLAFPPGYLRHITTTSPANLAIISVTGPSMVPTLYHDDIVMVDMTKTNTAYDGMFVVRHEGLLRVKRLRRSRDRSSVILVSDNEREHPPEEVPGEDVEVVGRVVWSGKKHP